MSPLNEFASENIWLMSVTRPTPQSAHVDPDLKQYMRTRPGLKAFRHQHTQAYANSFQYVQGAYLQCFDLLLLLVDGSAVCVTKLHPKHNMHISV